MNTELRHADYEAIVRVIQRMAGDVWDEQTIPYWVRTVCAGTVQTERVMLALANLNGYEAADETYTPDTYLDSMGWFHGWTHQRFIESLRAWLQEHHPDRDQHDYARARRTPPGVPPLVVGPPRPE